MINCQPNSNNLVNHWLNSIQHYLLPPKCVLCGYDGYSNQDLCQYCLDAIQLNSNSCRQCGEPIEWSYSNFLVCGACQKNPPFFQKTCAPFIYDGVIKYLIHSLKYYSHLSSAQLLGNLMSQQLCQQESLPEYIIPVPLHAKRYRQRGFNQAIEIAKIISNLLNVPMCLSSFERHKMTQAQSALPANKRAKNIRHAFHSVKPVYAEYVAIVDDVMTTGATVSELAKSILESGVKRVDVWVAARAQKY